MATPVEILSAIVPSLGVGLVFWFAMRAVIHADRREREALAQLEAARKNEQARQEPNNR